MKEYAISLISLLFLSVIISVIIPKGKLNGCILFVLRIVCVAIMVTPLTQIFKISEHDKYIISYEDVCSIYEINQQKIIEKEIEYKFSISSQCFVDLELKENKLNIIEVRVYVDQKNLKNSVEICEYLRSLNYINITVNEKNFN